MPHVFVGVNFVREISIPSLPSGGLIASTGGLCKAGDINSPHFFVGLDFVCGLRQFTSDVIVAVNYADLRFRN